MACPSENEHSGASFHCSDLPSLDNRWQQWQNYLMSLSFDPFAAICSVLVAALVVSEFRRNRVVRIELIDATASFNSDIVFGRYSSLQILIRNAGRPLHDVHLVLSFRPPTGGGAVACPLRRFNPLTPHAKEVVMEGEFGFGMIGYFGLKTHDMDPNERRMVCLLKDATKQCASIRLYSQGYLAKTFRLGTTAESARARWNEMAYRVNRTFDSKVWEKGAKTPLRREGKVIPKFTQLTWHVMEFLKLVETAPTLAAAQLFTAPQPGAGPSAGARSTR